MKGKVLFGSLGLLCALYGCTVLSIIGTRALFNWFYLALGVLLMAIAVIWPGDRNKGRKFRKTVSVTAAVLTAVFLLAEGYIASFAVRGPEAGADYVILLGTQMRTSGPSVDFRARIESAYDYLTENPGSKIIATGGRGGNEPVSEAEGARDYLVRKGISQDRIILEDRSTSTAENLEFSADLLRRMGEDPAKLKVVIVSADYHLCRASYIAGKTGFDDVSCKGSHGLIILLPHFYTRDLAALLKEIFVYDVIPVLTGRPAVPESAPAA